MGAILHICYVCNQCFPADVCCWICAAFVPLNCRWRLCCWPALVLLKCSPTWSPSTPLHPVACLALCCLLRLPSRCRPASRPWVTGWPTSWPGFESYISFLAPSATVGQYGGVRLMACACMYSGSGLLCSSLGHICKMYLVRLVRVCAHCMGATACSALGWVHQAWRMGMCAWLSCVMCDAMWSVQLCPTDCCGHGTSLVER